MLSFKLSKLAKVAVTPEKVEGVIDEPVLSPLQFGKIGPTFMDDHHLAVDDGLAGDVEGTGDLEKPFGPVQPVPGVNLLLAAVDVDLDAVAVELNLVEPLAARSPWSSRSRAVA